MFLKKPLQSIHSYDKLPKKINFDHNKQMLMLILDLMWTGYSVCEDASGGIRAIKSIAEDRGDLFRATMWNIISAQFEQGWRQRIVNGARKPFQNCTDRIFKTIFVCKFVLMNFNTGKTLWRYQM